MYIFEKKIVYKNWTLIALIFYIHVLDKLFVIKVHYFTSLFSYVYFFSESIMQNQNILISLDLLLNLSTNISLQVLHYALVKEHTLNFYKKYYHKFK